MANTDGPDYWLGRVQAWTRALAQATAAFLLEDQPSRDEVRELYREAKGLAHAAGHHSVTPELRADAMQLLSIIQDAHDDAYGIAAKRVSPPEAIQRSGFVPHQPVPDELKKSPRTVSGGLPSLGGRR